MFRNHKKSLILSGIVTLLPVLIVWLFRDRVAEEARDLLLFNLLVFPLSMVGAQWLCVGLCSLDKGNRDRNRKVLNLVLWIIPVITCVCSGILFALALGISFSPALWMLAAMGLVFAAIGNYMPKTRMNSTIGIKVSWAYTSEENWNATHRYAGKLWVAGGLLMAAAGFLPERFAVGAMFVLLTLMCLLPVIYSYRFYRRELAQGKLLKKPVATADPRIRKGSLAVLVVLLIFVASILWTGELHYVWSDTGFTVEADWYSDLTLRYDAIETVEYREGNVPGSRVGGFGSFRLLMGFFRNEEFGNHVRYTYYDPESCIVLTTARQTYVLSGADASETLAVYNYLARQIP